MASSSNSYRSISLPNPPLLGQGRLHRCGPSTSICVPATALTSYPCYLECGIERQAILSPCHYLELGTACVQAGPVASFDSFFDHLSHRHTHKIQNLPHLRVFGAFLYFRVHLVFGWGGCRRQKRLSKTASGHHLLSLSMLANSYCWYSSSFPLQC